MSNTTIREGYKDLAWFNSNPEFLLKQGQRVNYLQTGTYKIGDGITALSALLFLGGGSGTGTVTSVQATITGALGVTGGPIINAGTLAFAWQGNNTQQVLGDGSLAAKITNNNQISNGAGYVLATGQASTVNLNTQAIVAGYVSAVNNLGGAQRVAIQTINQSSSGLSGFNAISNDSATNISVTQLNTATVGSPGLYINNGSYVDSNGTELGIGTVSASGLKFYTNSNTRMTLSASGNLNIGNAISSNQRLIRIGQGTAWIDIGNIASFPAYPAIYLNQPTPSGINYAMIGQADGSGTQLNGVGSVQFSISDNLKAALTVSLFQLLSAVNFKTQSNVNHSNLPVSAAGLSPGDLWNNLGIINIA